MRQDYATFISGSLLILAMTGCATVTPVQPMPLEQALTEILSGIDGFVAERNRKATANEAVYPYLPSEAEVTLTLAAKHEQGGEVSVSVVPNQILTNVGGKWSVKKSYETGNSLKIKLQNIAFAPSTSWVGSSKQNTAAEITAAMDALLKHKVQSE